MRSGGQRSDGKARYSCASNHLSRLAEPVDRLVLDVISRVLVRDNVELLVPAADLTPLRKRLVVLRARADEIASAFGDPDSGMTGAQFKLANERLQGEIRSTEAEIGRRSGWLDTRWRRRRGGPRPRLPTPRH